jgi:hypothetical protein
MADLTPFQHNVVAVDVNDNHVPSGAGLDPESTTNLNAEA